MMNAMILPRITDLSQNPEPLEWVRRPIPSPSAMELLIQVSACGVCHTELDEIEGRTPPPEFPIILGHQVVGRVVEAPEDSEFVLGDRVGVGWIFSACGVCDWCRAGFENLCPEFRATGRDAHGGYAEYMVVSADFANRIPDTISDYEAAPLLCAGAVGYRSLRLTGLQNGQRLGLTGFGASGHLVLKMVQHQFPDSPVMVFARSETERRFAMELGAAWAGDTTETPPKKLHAIIDTTPVWKPVLEALRHLRPGGRLVINAIRKENADQNELLKLNYSEQLWLEKEIKSVANVTRQDVREFLTLAGQIPLKPEYQLYELADANKALMALKNRDIRGAKVLKIGAV